MYLLSVKTIPTIDGRNRTWLWFINENKAYEAFNTATWIMSSMEEVMIEFSLEKRENIDNCEL